MCVYSCTLYKHHISPGFDVTFFQIFMAMSVAGTLFQGYFFAFHLLNIVNNNQLLKGVIQAVTQNGKCHIRSWVSCWLSHTESWVSYRLSHRESWVSYRLN